MAGIETIAAKLVGKSAMLHHSDRVLCNPIHPLNKKLKKFTGKKKKTDEDHATIAELEWRAGLHWEEDVGLYVPGAMIEASIKTAARMHKLGKTVERAIVVQEDRCPMKDTGFLKTPEAAYKAGKWTDIRPARIQGKRVMRCRPIFRTWSCEATIIVDTGGQINRDEAVNLLHEAGRYAGLGDYRPRFGRFEAEIKA